MGDSTLAIMRRALLGARPRRENTRLVYADRVPERVFDPRQKTTGSDFKPLAATNRRGWKPMALEVTVRPRVLGLKRRQARALFSVWG